MHLHDYTGQRIEVYWPAPHDKWFEAFVKDYGVTRKNFSTLIYAEDNSEEYVQLLPNGVGRALGDGGKLEDMAWRLKDKTTTTTTAGRNVPSDNKSSKTKKSSTAGHVVAQSDRGSYRKMIEQAFVEIAKKNDESKQRGTFKEVCQTIVALFGPSLDLTPSGDARSTPVWKAAVRKVLFTKTLFTREKGTEPSGAHIFSPITAEQ